MVCRGGLAAAQLLHMHKPCMMPEPCLGHAAQRIVRMGGPVDDDMANLIVAQLLYLDSIGKEDITMYVNSPGGSVTAGQPRV